MIVVVPGVDVAANIPEEEPIVATVVLLLTHVPPVGAPVNEAPVEIHIDPKPEIVGDGLTVTVTPTAAPQPVV